MDNIIGGNTKNQINNLCLPSLNLVSDNDSNITIADTCTSGNYLKMNYTPDYRWIAKDPITVRLPNGDQLKNTHDCFLPIPNLPQDTDTARIFPGLQTASLLSIRNCVMLGVKPS